MRTSPIKCPLQPPATTKIQIAARCPPNIIPARMRKQADSDTADSETRSRVTNGAVHGIMERRFPDGGLLRYRK